MRPKLKIRVHVEELLETTGLAADNLELVASLRDFDRKTYTPLERWPLIAIPSEWPTPRVPLQSHGGFDLSLLICLRENLDKVVNRPYRRGSVVSRRNFAVRAEADALTFPIRFVDFPEKGWPDEALWVVHYIREEPDFGLPVNGVLELWVNKRAERKLSQASASPTGLPIMQLIATDVFSQVSERVLMDESSRDDWDEESLGFQLIRSLEGNTGYDLQTLQDLARTDSSRLRALIQSTYSLASTAESLDLRRY